MKRFHAPGTTRRTRLIALCRVGPLVAFAACAERVAFAGIDARVRSVVESRVISEAIARGASVSIRPIAFDVDTLAVPQDDLTIVRIWRTSDHVQPYVLAVARDTVLRLANFASPELSALARALNRSAFDSRVAASRARLLARSVDTHGAVHALFPGDVPPRREVSPVIRRWEASRPTGWPADTLAGMGDGNTLVRLTMLSQDTRNFATAWSVGCFACLFSRRGDLLEWSISDGEPFPSETGDSLPQTTSR